MSGHCCPDEVSALPGLLGQCRGGGTLGSGPRGGSVRGARCASCWDAPAFCGPPWLLRLA